MANLEMSGKLLACFALFWAVLHILPIASPFFTPFKGKVATLADFRCEAIFCLCFHGIKNSGVVAKLLCVNRSYFE